MLRTSAPLIGALYVSGLNVREGWLLKGIESNREAAVFWHLYARVLLAGHALDCDGSAKDVRSHVAVRHHAKLWKPKLSRVGGKGYLSAGPGWWFIRAGSISGTRHQ